MDDATYAAEIIAAYEGELSGEGTAAMLMTILGVDERRATKLDLLRRLEARVSAALAPIVARLGMAPADLAGLQERARARAVASWDALIAKFGSRLDPYVVRFAALYAAARPGDAPALALLVAHKRAPIAFVRLEANGDEDAALVCLRTAVG